MADDLSTILSMLERVERRLEGLTTENIGSRQEIANIKEDIKKIHDKINERLAPIESITNNLFWLSKLSRWVFMVVVSASAFLAAVSVLKEKFKW